MKSQDIAHILFLMLVCGLPACADDWPQWMGPKRDGVWRETGIVDTFPAGGPPVRWRVPIGGGYSGPAVVGNRVYVTDKQMPQGIQNPDNPFSRTRTPATERVVCLNGEDGSIVWKHEYECPYTVSYPAGPRTTPVVQDGRVYTLGSEGHLFCLEAKDGKVVWGKELKKDYQHEQSPVWGWSANLLLDGDRLICLVGGKGTAVVAFHKETGKEIWRAIDSSGPHGPGYSSPVIIEAGGKRQLIVWHPTAITSLDPESGSQYWTQPFVSAQGLSVATPRVSGDNLFISAFYNGSLLLKLDKSQPQASVVWKRHGENEKNTDALHCLMSTPVIDGDYIYGVCSHGETRCLDLKNGDRKWSTFEPTSKQSARWGNAFIVRHEGRYVLFSEQGDLILAQMTPEGYKELSRAHLLEPTGPSQRRLVVWTHPAFANRCVYVRNDTEIVCVSLAK